MTEMKHTPEEWFTERQDDESGEIYWAIHSAIGYEFIANAYNERHAHLIAAAPQLLAACVDALEALDGLAAHKDTNPWCVVLRAAIARALSSPETKQP